MKKLLLPLLVALTLPVQAANLTWSGTSDTTFSTGTNWVGDTAPANDLTTDIGVFGSSVTSNQPTLTGNYSVLGLEFQTTSGGWTLGGNTTTVLNLGTSGINASTNTSGNITINTSIKSAGSNTTLSVGAGGTLDIKGALFVQTAGTSDTIINGGTVIVDRLDDSLASTRAFQKAGNGTLVIKNAAGANFTGTTVLNNGITIIGNQDALGAAVAGKPIQFNGGTLQASTDLVGANAVSKTWALLGGAAVISGQNSIELSGNLTGSDGRVLTNNLDAGKSLTLSGSALNISSTTTNRTVTFSGNGTTYVTGNVVNGGNSTGSSILSGLSGQTGTNIFSGTNSYGGTTTLTGNGTTVFAKTASLYDSTEASWTKTNIIVNSGHTLALNVGGSGEFSTGNVTTILSNLTTTITNNGLRLGSLIGFDTTNASGNVFTYSGNITNSTGAGAGSLGVRKLGTNTLELTGANTYTGVTIVNAGTMLVSAGAINGTSGVTVDGSSSKFNYASSTALTRQVTVTGGGTFAHNSSSNYSGTLNLTNGILAGTNWNGTLNNLTIDANKTISPGNSPGTASTGGQTWAGGGSYVWELNNATGAAGSDPGWDLLVGTGSLSITATSGSRFHIRITSLGLDNTAGNAVNFNGLTTDYKWKIADFGSAITLDATAFALDTSAFTNEVAGGSTWAIALGDAAGIGGDNTQLWVTYSIPEPATWALLAFSLTTVMLLRRRRPIGRIWLRAEATNGHSANKKEGTIVIVESKQVPMASSPFRTDSMSI